MLGSCLVNVMYLVSSYFGCNFKKSTCKRNFLRVPKYSHCDCELRVIFSRFNSLSVYPSIIGNLLLDDLDSNAERFKCGRVITFFFWICQDRAKKVPNPPLVWW